MDSILWWQWAILLILATGVIMVLLTFLLKLIRKNKIKIPGIVTEACKGACKNILLVVEYQTEAIEKIMHLEEILLLRNQMNYAEESIGNIRILLRSHFLKLLKTINIDGLINSPESHNYENVLRIVSYELCNQFRFIFRENHLTTKTELEFESYIKAKTVFIQNIMTELLNEIYWEKQPSREVLYEHNKKITNLLNEIVSDVIRRGRIIAIENDRLIGIIKIELQTKMEGI